MGPFDKQIRNNNNHNSNHNHNYNYNHNYNKKKNGNSKHLTRCVWRCRKGGIRYYVALDGSEHEGQEAAQQCIKDRQTLSKLNQTKLQFASPGVLQANIELAYKRASQNSNINNNNNNNNNNIDSNYSQLEPNQFLSYWQIPSMVIENYEKLGIFHLYKWQCECLAMFLKNNYGENIDSNNIIPMINLLYSAPTSGGKTLIAEILMIRKIILSRNKKCVLILPFVSLVIEKLIDFKKKFCNIGIVIEALYGHKSVNLSVIMDCDIIITTIEKSNIILNIMLENCIMDNLGLVIIDELHMINDKHRGYNIEIIVSKLIAYNNKCFEKTIEQHNNSDNDNNNNNGNNNDNDNDNDNIVIYDTENLVQIVGMSATLPNLNQVAQWLNAKLFVSNIRPIPLTEYVKVNDKILNKYGKVIRELPMEHLIKNKKGKNKNKMNAKSKQHQTKLTFKSNTIANNNHSNNNNNNNNNCSTTIHESMMNLQSPLVSLFVVFVASVCFFCLSFSVLFLFVLFCLLHFA